MASEKAAAPEHAPGPPRFKSEDEDEEAETEESDAAFFFSSSRPAVATTVTVAASSMTAVEADQGSDKIEAEMAAPASKQLERLVGESVATPHPGNYAADLAQGIGVTAGQGEQNAEPCTSLFAEGEEAHRDLDFPAFLRRLQF